MWVVQRPSTRELAELGGQGRAVVDFLRPPSRDVQQQSVQRPSYQRGVRLVRERARVGVVVVVTVDPAA